MQHVRIERNGETWRAVWRDPSGRRVSRGLGRGTKRSVMKRARELAPSQMAARMSLTDWTDRYLSQRELSLEESTHAQHRHVLRQLAAFSGPIAVRDVSTMLVADFLGQLEVGDNTRRKACRYLRTIWRHAVDQGVAGANPWSTQPARHRAVDHPDVYVPAGTVWQVLGAAPLETVDGWNRLLGLTRFVGLRLHEARQARWCDVDLAGSGFTVAHEGQQTVKKRARRVPLDDDASRILTSPDVFTAERIVRGIRDPYRGLARLQRDAGIEPWPQPFHALRASCETDWLATQPLPDVCRWMGHSATVALEHYHRTRPETLRQEVGR